MLQVIDGELEAYGPSKVGEDGFTVYDWLRFGAAEKDLMVDDVAVGKLCGSYLEIGVSGRFAFAKCGGQQVLLGIKHGDRRPDDLDAWNGVRKRFLFVATAFLTIPLIPLLIGLNMRGKDAIGFYIAAAALGVFFGFKGLTFLAAGRNMKLPTREELARQLA